MNFLDTHKFVFSNKNDSFDAFKTFARKVQNKNGCIITSIHMDHGKECENHLFEEHCNEHGISHNFSTPYVPQQNVVERKNRTLQEMAKSMLHEYNVLLG